MCQCANGLRYEKGCAIWWRLDIIFLLFFHSSIFYFFILSLAYWHIDTLANYSLFLQFRLSVGLIVPV